MSSRTSRAACALACIFAFASTPAAMAAPRASASLAHGKWYTRSEKTGARSGGAPNHGHLVGAVRLRGSRTLHQREGSHSWALPQLVRVLHRAASEVARKHRGSQMLVGDLSGKTGGRI